MSFPNFNSVKVPTETILFKWSRKGKISLIDESSLVTIFAPFNGNIIAFAGKQGKAIVRFETIEIAQNVFTECENGTIQYNNTLKLHPYYCELIKAHEKKETIKEEVFENIDGINCIQIPEAMVLRCQTLFSCNTSKLSSINAYNLKEYDIDPIFLNDVNTLLSKSFSTCLCCSFNKDKVLSLFLEHNLWGDEYAFFVYNSQHCQWNVTVPIEAKRITYHCQDSIMSVSDKPRFCDNLLISCDEPSFLIVFTTKREGSCHCPYPNYCLSQLVHDTFTSVPTEMETKNVYEVYDKIAGHFSSTRYSQWNGVLRYLDTLSPYSIVLDLGCGNGKYIGYSSNQLHLAWLGCDRSVELLNICREKSQDVSLVDGLFLPYRDESVDSVISIAVLHHLSTNALRRRFLTHLIRVLKHGGSALIVVWAMEKDKSGLKTKSNRGYDKSDVMVKWKLQKKYTEDGEEECYDRYYHMFHEGELEWLLLTFEGIEVKESWYERENWFVIINKK